MCNEVAAILLGPKYGSRMRLQFAAANWRIRVDLECETPFTVHPFAVPHGELGWHLEVRYQGDATSHNNNRISCRNLPHTDTGSIPVGTHCSIVLQDCFCAQFPY